jgi:hypothetical protein
VGDGVAEGFEPGEGGVFDDGFGEVIRVHDLLVGLFIFGGSRAFGDPLRAAPAILAR